MSYFSQPPKLKGGSPAAPVPQTAQAASTERTLAQVRKDLSGPPPLPQGVSGGSSGALYKPKKPSPLRKGGSLPPSDVVAAAVETTRLALDRALKGGAVPTEPKRGKRVNAKKGELSGGLMPGVPITNRGFASDVLIPDNVYSGGPAVANNGITYPGFRMMRSTTMDGVRPNVSHGYAPVSSSWNATGLPGYVPPEPKVGLLNHSNRSTDDAVGQGGADIGDGRPGGAQRVQAAKIAGAGLPAITISDSDDSDTSSGASDDELEGGAFPHTKAYKRMLKTREKKLKAQLKQLKALKHSKDKQRRLGDISSANYNPLDDLHSPYRISPAGRRAAQDAAAIYTRHGYSSALPGTFGVSGLL